jgi:hypothetical protein
VITVEEMDIGRWLNGIRPRGTGDIMHQNSKEKRMKKDHSQWIRYVFIPLCMAMWNACMAALLPLPALAEPEGVQFETRTITDPQFGV